MNKIIQQLLIIRRKNDYEGSKEMFENLNTSFLSLLETISSYLQDPAMQSEVVRLLSDEAAHRRNMEQQFAYRSFQSSQWDRFLAFTQFLIITAIYTYLCIN